MEKSKRQKWEDMRRVPWLQGSSTVKGPGEGTRMVATISTVRELIFHDWHPTNPGSELGMSKSMTKTVQSCLCVCARNITSYPETHFGWIMLIACQLFESHTLSQVLLSNAFNHFDCLNLVSSPFLGSGGQG